MDGCAEERKRSAVEGDPVRDQDNKHSEAPANCGNCLFSDLSDDPRAPMGIGFVCRRFPKVIVGDGSSAHPKVDSVEDWCGEWREEK